MKKKFVIDTNVILSDPQCIYKFEDNDVYIPLIVVEEFDRHKKGQEEKARNAREFSREIDKLRQLGKLSEGVELHTGSKLFVTVVKPDTDIPLGLDLSINDDLIIYTALQLGAIVVSRDTNVRLKCDALNVPSCAAAKRLGFEFEGVFRQATIYKKRNRDTAWYSILDREWPSIKQAFENWLIAENFDSGGNQLSSLSSKMQMALRAIR